MKKEERRIIHRSLDGELSQQETRQFRRQLDTDFDVRREYEQLKVIEEESVRAIKPIEVPKNFAEKILGKIRTPQRSGG